MSAKPRDSRPILRRRGTRSTAFNDFDPEKDKRRIDNLPGLLVKKK